MTADSVPRLGTVLLVGVGRQGRRLLDVAGRIGLAGRIVTVDPSPRWRAGSETGEHFAELAQALAAGAYDAALVASPTATHAAVVAELLARRIPTLVEKPITATVAEGRELARLASATKTPLSVGYVERFNPVVRLLGDLLGSGRAGEPISLVLRRFGVRPSAPTDIDVIHDLSVHDIDLVAYLLGEPPTLLGAAGSVDPATGQADSAQLLLSARGVAATVETSRVAPRRERRVDVLTDAARLVADLLTCELEVAADPAVLSSLATQLTDPRAGPEGTLRIAADGPEPLAAELLAFVTALAAEGGPPLATSASALETSRIAEAASTAVTRSGQANGPRGRGRDPEAPSSATRSEDMIHCNPVRVDDAGMAAVQAALERGVIARGPNVAALEGSFRDLTGVEHVAAVSNGTIALVLAGLAVGLKPGDLVLVPAFSFAATANAFLSIGCDVMAVDVDARTYNLDPAALEAAIAAHPRARALVLVDLFGSTAGLGRAAGLARAAGLLVIEDAAQAVGAFADETTPIGARADVTTFSLYATKNVFAGEGGIVVTPHGEVEARVRALADHATIEVEGRRLIGLNYRMNELGAALAAAQMPKVGDYVALRRSRARRLAEACELRWHGMVLVPEESLRDDDLAAPRHVFHQFTVQAPDEATRVSLQDGLLAAGVETRRFYPYTLASLPGMTASSVPVADRLATCCFSLPIAHSLTDAELDTVLAAVASQPLDA